MMRSWAPNKKKQNGLTTISLLLLMSIALLLFMLVLKIAPLYTDNFKLESALKAVEMSPSILTVSAPEVKSRLLKSFDVNYVQHITEQDIKIVKQSGYLKVSIEYERVAHIVGNLSVLVEFNEGFEYGK